MGEQCRPTAEMVTIFRAEYEEVQAQSKRVSELENRVDVLMETLRLARHKQQKCCAFSNTPGVEPGRNSLMLM